MKDITKKCVWNVDGKPCGVEFLFTERDQKFYTSKGFSDPKYCHPHREERKKQQDSPFGEALRRSRQNKGKLMSF